MGHHVWDTGTNGVVNDECIFEKNGPAFGKYPIFCSTACHFCTFLVRIHNHDLKVMLEDNLA